MFLWLGFSGKWSHASTPYRQVCGFHNSCWHHHPPCPSAVCLRGCPLCPCVTEGLGFPCCHKPCRQLVCVCVCLCARMVLVVFLGPSALLLRMACTPLPGPLWVSDLTLIWSGMGAVWRCMPHPPARGGTKCGPRGRPWGEPAAAQSAAWACAFVRWVGGFCSIACRPCLLKNTWDQFFNVSYLFLGGLTRPTPTFYFCPETKGKTLPLWWEENLFEPHQWYFCL